jgi:hypothetical protein
MANSTMAKRIKKTLNLILSGHAQSVWNEVRKRFHSTTRSFELRRDLTVPYSSPQANIPIQIRPFKSDDLDYLLGHGQVKQTDPMLDNNQRSLAGSGLTQGYVAVTSNGHPCYMQWLIGPNQNDRLQSFYKGIFPPLADDEALLEGAFMQPNYTGLRIMPAAMSMITEKAIETGNRWVITYVDITNIPSLKGCHRSGYSPSRIRTDQWRFFRRTTGFSDIPSELLKTYENQVGITSSISVGNETVINLDKENQTRKAETSLNQ